MNRDQQSRQGFVCESCGQGFDSLQLLDEHQWNNKCCSSPPEGVMTPNQQTDREAMAEVIQDYDYEVSLKGPNAPGCYDLADRLISMGFTRAGSGVSGRVISEEAFKLVEDFLVSKTKELCECDVDSDDGGKTGRIIRCSSCKARGTLSLLRRAHKATPQPIALEGVPRYICTPGGMEKDDGLGGMLACWINVGDLVADAEKNEPESCHWKQGDTWDGPSLWSADCDMEWRLEEGGPKDNEMNFCPGCGKPLIEVPFVREEEDE